MRCNSRFQPGEARCIFDRMQFSKFVPAIMLALLAAPLADANPIELAPGLWQIDSEETKDVASDGRLNSQAPAVTTDTRCLDDSNAWLIPADYASSFTSRGCQQTSFSSTPLDFKGVWICRVDGLDLTINMKGEASLTGDTYATLMTVTGRNDTQSVNVRNTVNARRTGDCPGTEVAPIIGGVLPGGN